MHTIQVKDSLLTYRFNEIQQYAKESQESLDNSNLEHAATCARLMSYSAAELAVLLTQISQQ